MRGAEEPGRHMLHELAAANAVPYPGLPQGAPPAPICRGIPHAPAQAVYHMPTSEAADVSLPLALQSLFYKMQFGDSAVSTIGLTRSFGWDSADSFTQHDVQVHWERVARGSRLTLWRRRS